MADENDQPDEQQATPVAPIKRKKDDAPAEVVDAAPEPAPEPVEEPPAPAEPVEVPAEAPPSTAPVGGRRVVDMASYKPPAREKAAGGGDILVEKGAKPVETAGVRVEAGSFEDFEAMLAGEAAAPPRQLNLGEEVQGRVVSVGENWVYVDIDGIEALSRLHDYKKDGEITIAAGDVRKFYVIDRRDGAYVVGEHISTDEAALDAIIAAHEGGIPIEGKVASHNKGGFEVEIAGVRAFCPISQIELGYCQEPGIHIGNVYKFRVIELRDEGKSAVVSRAELLREEAEVARERAMASLKEGAEIPGVVTRLADFGAFVDLGGVEGLVHISELGFMRVDHPSELVKEGDQVQVKILRIEEGDKGPRIGLSMKDLMEDPRDKAWEEAAKTYKIGQIVEGTVGNVQDFGAFLELDDGLSALIPRSEMNLGGGKAPHSMLSRGARIKARVLRVEPERRRMALTLRSGEELEKEAAEAAAPRSYSDEGKGFGSFGDLLKDKLK